MNTRKHRIWSILATIIMVFPLILGLGNTKEVFADSEGNNTVIIHKKKMTKLSDSLIQNSGKEMAEFDKYQGLKGVTFSAYDVTEDFYNARSNGTSVTDAKLQIEKISVDGRKPVKSGSTDTTGDLTLSLPQKSNNQDAVYLIVETPQDGVTTAGNMVVAFPVYEMIKQLDGTYKYGTDELKEIHLYPKNIVSNSGSLTVNKVGTAENEALNGAEFVISKENSSQYITSVKDGLYTWSTDKSVAKHFVTGKSYEIGENDFIEANVAEGELKISGLEVGSYTLEEVKAPDNAALITDQTKTDFSIDTNKDSKAELTVKNDTSKVKKTTPELNGQDVAIGEKIQYQISVNIPLGIADKEGEKNKYNQFNLTDTHDEALTFDNINSGDFAYTLYDGDKVINPENYTVNESTNGFNVAVSSDFIPSLTPGGTLKFVYFMHLNEKADPTKGFKNEANVENGHTTDTTPPDVTVVTGGKRFVKIDGDVTADTTLADASFVVRDSVSDNASYLKIDDKKAATWTKNKSDATTFTTKEDGLVNITGLKYGTYYLEETQAPEDYVLLTNRIKFVVNKDSYGTTEELVKPEKVPNKHKGTLPSTGSIGIYFIIAAGVVAAGIAVFYFTKGRKQTEA